MKARCLPLAAGLLLAGHAFAQSPATTSPPIPEPQREVATADLPAEKPLNDRFCLRYTGSLIAASRNLRDDLRPAKAQGKPRCAPAIGRSWSREDLERTGALNMLDALRMLDPAVH